MSKEGLKIVERILDSMEKNPELRFGQILFNLGINEFVDMANPEKGGHLFRDIYNDTDIDILNRIK
jgi:hypothetical protein